MRIDRVWMGRCYLALALAIGTAAFTPQRSSAPTVAIPQRAPGRTPTPAIVVVNASPEAAWHGVVTVSIPWPRGALPFAPRHLRIGDDLAPCRTLMSWPDGSIAVLQAWPSVHVAADSRVELAVSPVGEADAPEAGDETRAATSTTAEPSRFDRLPIRTLLEGPFGESYVADLGSIEAKSVASIDGVFGGRGDAAWVIEREFDGVHLAVGDARAEPGQLLDLRAHLTEFPNERRAVLTLLLDNDPAPGEPAFGPVRFRSFGLETTRRELDIEARFAAENGLAAATTLVDSSTGRSLGRRFTLLGPSQQLYLGDRTAKAWRFDLWFGDAADPAIARRARLARHVVAMPQNDWTRHTCAFGMHGGPAPTPSHANLRGERIVATWRRTARFGPFGDFGDPADAAAGGTPRNGPSALHAIVALAAPPLWWRAEGQVLQHTLRPTPGYEPRRPRNFARWRQGMSPRTIERPHGFTRVDYEHFSVDLVFDWYWLTGDPLARRELLRFGRGLLPVLDGVPFRTARGEGWCMQAGAAIARALGDQELLESIHERFVARVLPTLGSGAQPYVIRQPPHDLVFGRDDHPFDAPWQMSALVHGLCALLRQSADPDVRLAEAAIHTARVMADVGWLEGVGPKCFVSALDPGRYRMPVGHGPLEGTAHFQVGAFVLAAELATELHPDDPIKGLLAKRADSVMAAAMPSDAPDSLRLPVVDPWFQLYLDRHR